MWQARSLLSFPRTGAPATTTGRPRLRRRRLRPHRWGRPYRGWVAHRHNLGDRPRRTPRGFQLTHRWTVPLVFLAAKEGDDVDKLFN
jgi:hypothetical protein